MDQQDIFDTVLNALRKQGIGSFKTLGSEETNFECNCLYRGSNNTKCAAGHLIPDDIYNVEMEGDNINYIIANSKFTLPEFFYKPLTRGLIVRLQSMHDEMLANPEPKFELWELGMANIAASFGLTYTSLTNQDIQ